MARNVKFPLKMADGEEVRTLEEFKEHFDIESAVKYFSDGSLLVWLQSRYYDEESDKISKQIGTALQSSACFNDFSWELIK